MNRISISPIKTLLTIAFFLFLVVVVQAQSKTPKNIIVLIGDGLGYNHISATNYFNGVDSTNYQKFPVYFPMSTYPAMTGEVWENTNEGKYNTGYNSYKAWSDWNFIKGGYTGSAPAATSLASGKKSSKYAIGVAPDGSEIELITERAVKLGKSAGVVSSVEFSHATPASFSVHNISRNNYSQIANSAILDSKLSVIMGCGHPKYDVNAQYKASSAQWDFSYVGGQATWDSLEAGATIYGAASIRGNQTVQDIDDDENPDPWTLIQDSIDFANLATGITPKRVVGVPKVYKTLQYDRSGDKGATAFGVPFNSGVPTLEQMTNAAINILDNDEDGFFLMIEGGAIDWAGHDNSLGRTIEEQTDFNNTVDAVIEWVGANGGWEENLVIVTGDHETGYLVGSGFVTSNMAETYSVIDNGANNMPGAQFLATGHTNQLIPLFSNGAGSELFNEYADEEDFVRGRYVDNTNVAHVCFDLWPEVDSIAPEPKYIFIMISDGCGYNQISATNYYNGETQAYEDFPIALAMSTYPAMTGKVWENDNIINYDTWFQSSGAWQDWNFVNNGYTGSASAATAMYSGVKTAKYAIGVAIDSTELKTIGERAIETGKSAGVVSSVPFSHATPACMVSHNIDRNNYAQIANEMIIDSKLSVIMGCGHPYYDANSNHSETVIDDKYIGGEGTWQNLIAGVTIFDSLTIQGNSQVQDIDGDEIADPWTLITDSIDFANLDTGKTPLRVIGVPKSNSTLQQGRIGSSVGIKPYEVALNENVPTLEQMTKAAINVLDNNLKGFLLMVEGGAVDWAGHANQIERIIEEENDFNNSVDAVINWIETNSNWDESLVIVTGDHETGYLVGPAFNTTNIFNTCTVTDNGVDNLPGYSFLSTGHTNQLIPFYTKGAGINIIDDYADHYDVHRGRFLNNTEIAQSIFKMWKKSAIGSPNIDTSQIITLVSIQDVKNKEINIFPNPTNGTLFINTKIEGMSKVTVVDIMGKCLLNTTFNKAIELDLNDYVRGVYFINVVDEKNIINQKVIIK